MGERQRDGDLAIVLFAELTTVLPGYTDRVLALFGKPGVVKDPGGDRALTQESGKHASRREVRDIVLETLVAGEEDRFGHGPDMGPIL